MGNYSIEELFHKICSKVNKEKQSGQIKPVPDFQKWAKLIRWQQR